MVGGVAPREVGVVPYGHGMTSPADRRRIGCWARSRQVRLDWIHPQRQRIVVINPMSDLRSWTDWRRQVSSRRLVLDVIDFRYLSDALEPRRNPTAMIRNLGRSWLYGSQAHSAFRDSFRRNLERALRAADRVVCSSPEQGSYLASFGIPAQVVLHCHEEIPALPPRSHVPGSSLRLLWEGQLATLTYVASIQQALQDTSAAKPIELLLCTDLEGYRFANRFGPVTPSRVLRGVVRDQKISMTAYPWSPSTLAQLAKGCHGAIIPIAPDDSSAWMKDENRALIMWKLGLPAIMSPTPAYQRVSAAAGVTSVAKTAADWTRLLPLLTDNTWRLTQARSGYDYIIESHTPELIHSAWDGVFASLDT